MSAIGGKPSRRPDTPYGSTEAPLHIQGSWVWAPLKRTWLARKPEEIVRQRFIYRLHEQWGYPLEQMRQEVRTQRGRGSTRADVVVAKSPEAAKENRDWIIVVETKAETVPIDVEDYGQGESYARAVGAEFLVMHNEKETSYCRLIPGAPGDRAEITGIPRVDELDDARRLDEIRHSTKTFTRDEFQRLLFECHSILRDNHKMDPGTAFDEISKILFIKMAYERHGQSEVFTTERLRQIARVGLPGENDDVLLQHIFNYTKGRYKTDQLFGDNEKLKVSLVTFKRIVSKLEKFNLSDTGDDVKGIAFERFLGDTFRGELGQFFTPRPLVDFMVEMLDPQEGELVCDPASGTGGFLIRVFEHVRARIERDIQKEKAQASSDIEIKAKNENWSDDQLVSALEGIQIKLNKQLDVTDAHSRLYRVAHDCIYGTDAEARAARTSKMNMIMHGDGHGGIHYHDGLLDVNGIFEGRFDVVLTNPPFGANVRKDQIVGSTEQTRVEEDEEELQRYQRMYGAEWKAAHDRMLTAAEARQPILELFDIGRDPIGGPWATAKVRPNRPTEQLFIERCLNLLKPGGRMGIVLPDGILNNPSLAWLRQYIEGRANLRAVVSVPQEVFASSKATVKTSIVFLQRFTDEEQAQWEAAVAQATEEADAELSAQWVEVANLRRRAVTFDRPDTAEVVDEIDKISSSDKPDAEALRDARSRLRHMLSDSDRERAQILMAEVQSRTRELDRLKRAMVRARARELTSHLVFMAEVSAAGITSTGETGPTVRNELPELVPEYRKFLKDPKDFSADVMRRLAETDANSEAS